MDFALHDILTWVESEEQMTNHIENSQLEVANAKNLSKFLDSETEFVIRVWNFYWESMYR